MHLFFIFFSNISQIFHQNISFNNNTKTMSNQSYLPCSSVKQGLFHWLGLSHLSLNCLHVFIVKTINGCQKHSNMHTLVSNSNLCKSHQTMTHLTLKTVSTLYKEHHILFFHHIPYVFSCSKHFKLRRRRMIGKVHCLSLYLLCADLT